MPTLIDLSHTVKHGLISYPGLPGPEITDHLSYGDSQAHYDAGTEFHIARISMVANTGTYLDAPAHRYRGSADLSELPLDQLVNLPGVLIQCAGVPAIGPDRLPSIDLEGHAVLFHTGWSRHWSTDAYLSGHPYLTADTAQVLAHRKVALVGIDSLNIDDNRGGARPVHSTLLKAGIPIVEHLTNLGELPGSGFRFTAVPVKVAGMGSFPVRAYAEVAEQPDKRD